MKNFIYSLLIWVMCCLQLSNALASSYSDEDMKKKDVPIEGKWEEKKRSISGDKLLFVSWDDTNLYIENPSGSSEIHVSISNGFETVLPEGTTSAVVYVGAIEGPCVVVLTNQFGDRVEGILK